MTQVNKEVLKKCAEGLVRLATEQGHPGKILTAKIPKRDLPTALGVTAEEFKSCVGAFHLHVQNNLDGTVTYSSEAVEKAIKK